MLGRVPATLGCARLTDLGAQPAELQRERAVPAHQGYRQAAEIGAVAVQADAPGHHLDVLLFETSVGAVLARGRALFTGFDAVLTFLMRHAARRRKTRASRLESTSIRTGERRETFALG
jgi:hypothetical protein